MQGWQWTAEQRKRNEANTQHNKRLELGKQNYEKRQQHLIWTKNGNEMSRWLSPNYELQIQHNKLVKKIRTYWPVEKLCSCTTHSSTLVWFVKQAGVVPYSNLIENVFLKGESLSCP